MNPLPRLLGMTLFVVIAVLAGLLAVPFWHQPAPPVIAGNVAAGGTSASPSGPNAAALLAYRTSTRIWQRSAFAVATVGLLLTAALVVSLAIRGRPDTRPPMSAARQDIGTLARLAETSVAQGAELSRERDVRRRAEEDAELKQQLLAQSVEEKIRIGRDLHDGIIQSLYAAGLTLETIRPLLKTDPTLAEQRLDQIRANLNDSIREVRSYITGLAPENLRRTSFSRAIATMFEQLCAGRNVQFDLNVDDDAAAKLTVEQSVEALQIAREAISNALRHGHATRVTLRMHQGDGEVGLLIQDNGLGFDPAHGREGGHGLANMQARATGAGATLRITSQPGQGVRVIAAFPGRGTAKA